MVVGKGGQVQTITLDLSSSGNWYDLVVTSADKYGKNGKNGKNNLSHEEIVEATTTASFYRRFMGRMETGKDSITDPAMAAGKLFGWVLPCGCCGLHLYSHIVCCLYGHRFLLLLLLLLVLT